MERTMKVTLEDFPAHDTKHDLFNSWFAFDDRVLPRALCDRIATGLGDPYLSMIPRTLVGAGVRGFCV
jgi:hypothetical protein